LIKTYLRLGLQDKVTLTNNNSAPALNSLQADTES